MGHIQNADGSITVQATPTQTVVDLQSIADRAEQIGGVLKVTSTERLQLSPEQTRPGWLFSETDTRRLYLRTVANPQGELVYSPPTNWVDVGLFGSGFNPYRASGWNGVQTRVVNGFVVLNGAAINSNPWSAGVAICNINQGIRPPFNIQGSNCFVGANGDVYAQSAGSGAVSFSASWPFQQ